MVLLLEIFLLLVTYLWGSIPFGYLLTKRAIGENILELGSGNVGSTNVKRIAGKKMAVITQLLDLFKGFLPVALYMYFNTYGSFTATIPYYSYLLGITSIIGHDFSVFLKFKGGKGVNTTLGASVLVAPYAVFISVALYYIVKWRFKYVSLGSILLGIALPLSELLFNHITPTFYYLLICSALIIVRHQKNISRLVRGTELQS